MELFDVIMDRYIKHISDVVKEIPEGQQRFKALIKTMFGLGKNRELLSEKSYYAFYYLGLFDNQIKFRFNQKYKQFTDMVSSEIKSSSHLNNVSQQEVAQQTELLLSLFEGFTFKSNIRMNNDHFEEFGSYFFEKACVLFNLSIEE